MQPMIFLFIYFKESVVLLFLDKQIYRERTSKTCFESGKITYEIKHDFCNK